jgi:brefeldin A-inhibited guanine nucleotide-exchange protein
VDFGAAISEVTRFKQIGAENDKPDQVSPEVEAALASATSPSNHSRRGSLGAGRKFSDHEEHLYFWMPLLIGLTELTFDPRPAVRRSALDVLFDILMEHGACYSEGFWAKVFERMLLPIFDSVQVDDIDFATFSSKDAGQAEEQSDRWLYETCSVCLEHLIDLMVKFYPLVHTQLPPVLAKIKSFMLRTHHSLACVGVTAMEKLITRSGPQMGPEMWLAAAQGLLDVARETTPDLEKVVTFSRQRYFRDVQEPGVNGAAFPQMQPSRMCSRTLCA